MLEEAILKLAEAIRENTEVTRQALASRGTPAPQTGAGSAIAEAVAKETPKPKPKAGKTPPAAEPEPAPALSVVTDADEDLPDPEVDLDDAPEATEEMCRDAFRKALAAATDPATVKSAYAAAIIAAGGVKEDGKTAYLPNVPAGNHGKLLAQFTAAIA